MENATLNILDWLVLGITLTYIVGYGMWKTRGIKNSETYLKGEQNLRWWTIGLSVVATQASAITFLSTPGQAFEDGMRFIQFYFGLPIAMVIISATILPIYYKLKVYTAYEYLEGRFDLKMRTLTAIFFLIHRGIGAGIVIYAPAIILSTIMGWPLNWTIWIMGFLVILYTVAGGTDAVSQTQKQQMIIILSGMVIATGILIGLLPENVSFGEAVDVAGYMGKLNVVDLNFDPNSKYNIWTGLLGGTFLALSYFGTDQSQVQRYLSGRSLRESRLGLLFNALFKVPMQFGILFLGAMLFVFYQFHEPPVFFNQTEINTLKESKEYSSQIQILEAQHSEAFQLKRSALEDWLNANDSGVPTQIATSAALLDKATEKHKAVRKEVFSLISQQNNTSAAKDSDYVFISFVTKYLPHGLIGLLLAVIFSAAMSTTASELNALATTTSIDLYKRQFAPEREDQHYLKASKLFTVGWGCIALFFATYVSYFDNLIEAVNIVGSLFYGPILGVFVVALYLKNIGARAVFPAAIIAEIMVLALFALDKYEFIELAYLWLNPIGCILVVGFAFLFQKFDSERISA